MRHADEGTLHAHLDDELSAAELSELRAHLAVCAVCREQLDGARRAREEAHAILRRADPPPVSAPDFATILARREQAAAPPTGATRGRTPSLVLAWAASVVLALGAGWFAQELLRGSGEMEISAISPSERSAVADGLPTVAADDASAVESSAVDPGFDDGAAIASRATPAPPAADASAEASTLRSEGTPPDEAEMAVALSRDPPDVPLAARQMGEVSAFGTARAAKAADEEGFGVGEWVEVDAAGAAARLGRPPALIPELAVLGYAAAADGSSAVRVTQRLPGGELAQVLQRPAVDHLDIVVRAALPADSLERLRGAVR